VSFLVGETEAGLRADMALASLAGISRSQARRWIDAERVWLNRRPCRASQPVQLGDALEADPPEALPSSLQPEALPLRVLYEDADLIVIDKPAGLVVHPAPGHATGTLVNALLHHCRDLSGVGGISRPGIVHRLDRGTSGAMVVAKHDESHRGLARQFHDHSIERIYRALVRGLPGAESGRIERSVGRHPRDRKRMSVRSRSARSAATAWRVLRRFRASERSWLELRPETGRTHQLRVHLASAGLPIEGDPVYGRARRGSGASGLQLERPALHAAVLGFTHPLRGERLRFEAPLPADLDRALAALDAREA
jgi:23S rRNA pseudouridine1911/1915/1917 synthase